MKTNKDFVLLYMGTTLIYIYIYIYIYIFIIYLPFQEAKSGRSLLTDWVLKMRTFVVLTIVLKTLLSLF